MKLVIVTGMSGAGKTYALKMLEDMNFFCIDNLPISLMEKFSELLLDPNPPNAAVSPRQQSGNVGEGDFPHIPPKVGEGDFPKKMTQDVALGIDIRSGEELGKLNLILDDWKTKLLSYEILFLDAEDRVLVKRYKESRRSHPLSGAGRLDEGIIREREELQFLKQKADYIIDTSQLLTKELRQELEKIFVDNQKYQNLFLTVLSFGFKYGVPVDADLVFDVRFLPNPYYEEELRSHTGEEKIIQDYVMQGQTATVFLDKLYDMLDFLIPNYILEGKNQLVAAIGCTGGKHRSVTIAQKIYERYKVDDSMGMKIEHRDIDKDNKWKNRG